MNDRQPDVTVTIELFAIYQETFGMEKISYQFPANTPVKAVLDRMIGERPQLAQWRDVTRFGINLEFVEPETIVCDGDKIVLIPPVSGG
jgi:sulfur-carrier protein